MVRGEVVGLVVLGLLAAERTEHVGLTFRVEAALLFDLLAVVGVILVAVHLRDVVVDELKVVLGVILLLLPLGLLDSIFFLALNELTSSDAYLFPLSLHLLHFSS